MPDRYKLKITVLKRMEPSEIFEEMPVKEQDWMVPCRRYTDGQEIIVEENLQMPEGFCQSACVAIFPTIRTLGFGGNLPYFDERGTAISCCTDGMRPVIFKIERI